MNIDKYKIFLLVSENKKITEIANLLGISQPTVSFHIRSLEESMGVQLFLSDKKTLSLTDTGRHLLPYAKEIVELEENMLKRALEYKNYYYGEIYIGSTLSPGISLLPAVIHRFAKVYQNIHITIESKPANEIIQNTLSKKYDLGLVATKSEIPSDLTSEILKEEQLELVFHPDLLPAFLKDSSIKAIEKYPFIHHSNSSSTRKIVDGFLNEHQLQPASTITVNSVEMIKAMIMKQIGISFLPYALVSNDLAAGRLATVELEVTLPSKQIKLIYAKNRYIAPHILKFIEFAKQDPFVSMQPNTMF